MRERLVALLVFVTLAVVALYGVPRAYFLADLVQGQQEREVARSAATIAAALTVQETHGVRVTESFLAAAVADGDRVVYTPSGGGGAVSAGDSSSSESDIARTVELEDGGEVTVARSGGVVAERVADAILPLVVLGVALVAASAVAGVFLARPLSRPFQQLAGAARSLGHGRFDQQVPHYSIPEAEAIGEALRRSSAQLDQLVSREREFAVNASHVLLTPITALNLQLEDVSAWPETPPAVAEELQEALGVLDQLTATVRGLLEDERAIRRTGTRDVDLATLAAEVVEAWRPAAAEQGRDIRLEVPGAVPATLAPAEVTEVLDALLDNACRHGQGTITVDCAELATHLRVRVADEGRSDARSDVIHRQGPAGGGGAHPGLEAAGELAEAQGGYLLRDDSATTRYSLMLPKPPRADGSAV